MEQTESDWHDSYTLSKLPGRPAGRVTAAHPLCHPIAYFKGAFVIMTTNSMNAANDRPYRLLVDSIRDYAIYMLDLDGRVVSWNAGAQRFKGYRRDEILGEHFSRFYRENDRVDGLPMRALHIARTIGKFEAEGHRIRKDGSAFWAHVVIDPVFDDEGTHIGYAKITRDLSERAEAEATLKRSEDQFRLLVQSVTDYAIYMLDANGYVSSWNPGAQRIKGYAPDAIIGKHFSRFYTSEDQAAGAPAAALATAVREGRFATESWRCRKDETRFWASVVIDPIRDDDGNLVGFAKITRDLTERQEAQKELERAREALFQSQKMDAIGQLTGGIAHDFNNLLMATLSSLELLRKHVPESPQARRLLDNAVQGAQRGATLTQRMLAFARRQDLTPTRVEIPALVQGISELISRSLGPSFAIETRFPPDLNPVMADANQLEMALLNLVVNARDAMPDGGEIVITARQGEIATQRTLGLLQGEYIALDVIDKGVGMGAETLARAAEPFFTTKGVGKGTGLGLPMVHGLAEQLGGRLVLESGLGTGTTATLWLPAFGAPDRKDAAPAETQNGESDARPLKVLAVDDDALVLMGTAALLEDLGHTVLEAHSGAKALEIYKREVDIDLVVTDQAMPQMTGLKFAEAALTERPGVPFILATGYSDLAPPPEMPITRLGKPFMQHELARSIAEAMKAGRHKG